MNLLWRFGILCVGLWLQGGLASGAPAADGNPPNIVWLTVEDMSPWLACYGDATVRTPAIDRLANHSLRYTNAFATSPVCAAARSTLITGLYATRIGSMHHRVSDRDATDGGRANSRPVYEAVPSTWLRCFPEVLRRAGYYCCNNSKEDYQFQTPPTVWDESSPTAHWKKRGPDQPFFAVFNHVGTHESQAFPDSWQRAAAVKKADVPLPPYYPDTPRVRDAVARTYNNIARMDHWVGKRLGELREAGLLQNTIVFFFSDHGAGLPRAKRSPYDTGLRVPLLVRFPAGQQAGESTDRVVSFVDFAPTVLSLAGVKPDERLDGTPFLGEFSRPASKYAFANADRFDNAYDRARTVSNGHLRYVRNYEVTMPYLIHNSYRELLPMMADLHDLEAAGKSRPEQWQIVAKSRAPEELYDSTSDPWNVVNRIDDPALQDELVELRGALDQWIQETGDLGLIVPESRMVQEELWQGATSQPRTDAPAIQVSDGKVSIACATEGASIGYRLEKSGPWKIYVEPFSAKPNALIQVVAHRIGWKRAMSSITAQGQIGASSSDSSQRP